MVIGTESGFNGPSSNSGRSLSVNFAFMPLGRRGVNIEQLF